MRDEHEAAALVVVLQVVVERVLHIVVLKALVERHGRARREHPAEADERDLAVHRRIRLARRGEARELLADDVGLRRIRVHVAVRRLIGRHRRIDVEAIDRRLRIGSPRFARQLAVGGNDRRRVIDRARVLAAGTAEPRFRIAVVVRLRWRRGLGRRRLRGRGDGMRQARKQGGTDEQSSEHGSSCVGEC